jgi:hypothetical protein
MIKILEGLDQLENSDRDIQVIVRPDQIVMVTLLDEIYIDLLADAQALRDALDSWIEQKIERIEAGERR